MVGARLQWLQLPNKDLQLRDLMMKLSRTNKITPLQHDALLCHQTQTFPLLTDYFWAH